MDDTRAPVISAAAAVLAAERGIGLDRLHTLGLARVRRFDVWKLARSAGSVVTMPRAQRAVAAAVTASHRTIPAAFVAMRVRVGAAQVLARKLTRAHKRLIGLPELVLKAVADRRAEFPSCFAALDPTGATMRVPDEVDIGVTMDVGKGLVVPVVRGADRSTVPEIAAAVMAHRMTALRGVFRPSDVTGAAIVLALHNDEYVNVAVPIVYPGQSCAVSLSATTSRPALADDGTLVDEPVAQLGLAHDHRLVNGREAVLFLAAVKAAIESPEWL